MEKFPKFLILVVFLMILISGCSKVQRTDNKINVITTIYPLFEFSRAVGGNVTNVKLLLPPGSNPHTYEPTPKQIIDLENADLFIYIGPNMEPWISDVLDGLHNKNLKIIECEKLVNLRSFEKTQKVLK